MSQPWDHKLNSPWCYRPSSAPSSSTSRLRPLARNASSVYDSLGPKKNTDFKKSDSINNKNWYTSKVFLSRKNGQQKTTTGTGAAVNSREQKNNNVRTADHHFQHRPSSAHGFVDQYHRQQSFPHRRHRPPSTQQFTPGPGPSIPGPERSSPVFKSGLQGQDPLLERPIPWRREGTYIAVIVVLVQLSLWVAQTVWQRYLILDLIAFCWEWRTTILPLPVLLYLLYRSCTCAASSRRLWAEKFKAPVYRGPGFGQYRIRCAKFFQALETSVREGCEWFLTFLGVKPTESPYSTTYSSDEDEDDADNPQLTNCPSRGTVTGLRETNNNDDGSFPIISVVSNWMVKVNGNGVRESTFPLQNTTMTRIANWPIPKIALGSRVLVLVLGALTTFLFGGLKHNGDGFKFTEIQNEGKRIDSLVDTVFGGFANWDGQYFLHVAMRGYTMEPTTVFFPLFPMLVSFLSNIVHPVLGFLLSLKSVMLITSWIINTACFVGTAKLLVELIAVGRFKVNPTTVIFLFSFNPASIFFSNFYSESLFLYLSTNVILSLYKRQPTKALCWASLSSCCRSNGVLNFGFVGAYFLQDALQAYKKGKDMDWVQRLMMFVCSLAVKLIGSFLFLLPFMVYQAYVVLQFCKLSAGDSEKLPPYCHFHTLPYTHVQNNHWNVGFLKYYEWKQIPNFLLAFPVLLFQLSMNASRFFSASNRTRVLLALQYDDIFEMYVAFHGFFLACFCLLCIHVQVSTRLIFSSFPLIFIYLGSVYESDVQLFRRSGKTGQPKKALLINLWCLAYFLIGTLSFPLGYPWT